VSDELRQRLRAANPVPVDRPVEPANSPRTRGLLEAIMQTDDRTAARRRWPAAVPAVAALATVAAGGLVLSSALRDDPPPESSYALQLDLPSGTSMGSCLRLSASELGRMSPAFAGTATQVSSGSVVLNVDEWYAGGDAEQVVLDVPDDQSRALLGEVTFVENEKYLITAANGTVNLCGFSGPATPQLQALYDDAFAK
jgi:hypothetical protein